METLGFVSSSYKDVDDGPSRPIKFTLHNTRLHASSDLNDVEGVGVEEFWTLLFFSSPFNLVVFPSSRHLGVDDGPALFGLVFLLA